MLNLSEKTLELVTQTLSLSHVFHSYRPLITVDHHVFIDWCWHLYLHLFISLVSCKSLTLDGDHLFGLNFLGDLSRHPRSLGGGD